MVAKDGERYILARDRQAAYERELEGAAVAGTLTGAELVGRRYEPLFPYLADAEKYGTANAFRVILSDDVTTEDGTGVVHMAPAYGEADALACNAAGIPTVLTVDEQARFTAVVPDFAGQHVFDANAPITAKLREQGSLVRKETYTHSYPHCWRCRNPLIYKAVSSWFVAVSTFSDRMVELNEQITWVPEHVKHGQFGKWLANARGLVDQPEPVLGLAHPGLAERRPGLPAHRRVRLAGRARARLRRPPGRPAPPGHRRADPAEPGRPDRQVRDAPGRPRCSTAGSSPARCRSPRCTTRSRTASGSTRTTRATSSSSTSGRPAAGSTRCTCWPPRCSTGPSFTSCVSHGIVLGNDGAKMSKSLRNYPDVNEVFDTFGSDAMRWFLMASPVLRGGNLVVTEQGIREGRQAGDPAAVELLLLLRAVRQCRGVPGHPFGPT